MTLTYVLQTFSPSAMSFSLISHANIVGFSLLYDSILATTSGVATLGLDPPIIPGALPPFGIPPGPTTPGMPQPCAGGVLDNAEGGMMVAIGDCCGVPGDMLTGTGLPPILLAARYLCCRSISCL